MKNLILIIATLFNFSLVAQIRPVSTVVIPKQAGNAGKVLSTNGNNLNWLSIPTPTYAPGVSAALTGSGTVGYLPMYSSANTFTNSEIFQTGAGFGSTVTVAGVAIKNRSIDLTGSNNFWPGEIKADAMFSNAFVITNSGYINSTGGTPLNISTNYNDVSICNGGGKVGIGTNSPVTKLHVEGDILTLGGTRSGSVVFGAYSFWGSAANEITTFKSSTGSDLILQNLGAGNVSIGTATATAKLHILQNTTSTSAKALSVNTGSGELLSIDDNTYTNFYGLGFNVNGYGGNANMNLLSSSGAYDPTLTFKYNGGSTSGTISGSSSSLWIRPTGNLLISQTYANPTSIIQVVGLVEYADNAAAITAGLTVGAFYRTGDLLKVVH